MIVVVVDAHTGELVGARYIDGGVRSSENADLASGYAPRRGALAVG